MIRRSARMIAALTLPFVLTSGAAMAYTVITRDGHRIEAQARPEVRGPQAFMRLAPGGQLAVIADGKIDWQRTDAVNPTTGPIAVPATAIMTEAPDSHRSTKPIELKLYGGPAARTVAETPNPAAPKPQPKGNAGEAIINLQKEYAQVAAARDTEAAAKKMMEDELARLQARPVGYASETSSNEQRIRELTERIASSGSRIGMLESRLGDIRSEVIQLGGTID